MKERLIWIYDLEQFANFHCATFYNIPNNLYKQFVIHKSRNDVEKYYYFLMQEVDGLIGFNNLEYDYPLLHYFIYNAVRYISTKTDPDKINEDLFIKSNVILNTHKETIPYWKILIRQLDLRKVHHFDNKAKMANLKQLGIAMNYPDIEDLPFEPEHMITDEEVPKVLSYNLKDIGITKMLYDYTRGLTDHPEYKGKDMIKLRLDIKRKYKIPCDNYNDVKIGEEINKVTYMRNTGLDYNDFRYNKTFRDKINLIDCISDDIKFETLELKGLLNRLKTVTITDKKDGYQDHVIIGNKKYTFKLGGLHSKDTGMIIKPKENEMLLELDVASMYPRAIINDKLYPEHLGEAWLIGYIDIHDQRINAKHNGDKLIADTLKLALNGGGYGKTGESTSWMYDPLVSLRVTIRGQLRILMLVEKLVMNSFIVLSANTDGILVFLENKNDYDKFLSIYKQWEKETGFELEETEYKMIAMRDVNNYIALKSNDKIKLKGIFEINKLLHKNHSMKIVSIAVVDYFTKNIPYQETIRKCTDIKDFLISVKFSQSKGIVSDVRDGNLVEEIYKKNFRYFISTDGKSLVKAHNSGRIERMHYGFLITPFNKFYDVETFSDYNVNYSFYENECDKIIRAIHSPQFELNFNE